MNVSDIRNNRSWWIQEEKHKSIKKEQLEKQKFMEVEIKLTSQSNEKRGGGLGTSYSSASAWNYNFQQAH